MELIKADEVSRSSRASSRDLKGSLNTPRCYWHPLTPRSTLNSGSELWLTGSCPCSSLWSTKKSRRATHPVVPCQGPGLLGGVGSLRWGRQRWSGVLLGQRTCSKHQDLSASRTIDVSRTAKRAEIVEFSAIDWSNFSCYVCYIRGVKLVIGGVLEKSKESRLKAMINK